MPSAEPTGGERAVSPVPGSLWELLQLDSAPLQKRWRTRQSSGFDRDGGFYDSGNFLRIDEGPAYVLLDEKGPGCIDRMWFTYKKKLGEEPYDLLIYLDDFQEPAIFSNLDELFSGRHAPFLAPLAGRCGLAERPGRYSYVPVGFQKRCKVVLRPTAPPDQYNYRQNAAGERIPHIYYQITWRKLPAGSAVRTFRWDLPDEERQALERVLEMWRSAGEPPVDSGLLESHSEKTVEPGGRAALFKIDGAGVIRSIQIEVGDPGGLAIDLTWDGAKEPQVAVPLGPFFGCRDGIPGKADVRGLWFSHVAGRFVCRFPMPFRRGAAVALRSQHSKPSQVRAILRWDRKAPPAGDGIFRAHRYDYTAPAEGQDYTVLDLQGAGHMVGIVMDRPGHMEGDDRFFIDGESSPSIHGTGTEDFFNFAWGLSRTGSLPLHGITQQGGPVAYRVHLPAAIPFQRSIRVLWEHGHHPERGPNLDRGRYSGVVFYYLQEQLDAGGRRD